VPLQSPNPTPGCPRRLVGRPSHSTSIRGPLPLPRGWPGPAESTSARAAGCASTTTPPSPVRTHRALPPSLSGGGAHPFPLESLGFWASPLARCHPRPSRCPVWVPGICACTAGFLRPCRVVRRALSNFAAHSAHSHNLSSVRIFESSPRSSPTFLLTRASRSKFLLLAGTDRFQSSFDAPSPAPITPGATCRMKRWSPTRVTMRFFADGG